MTQTLAAACTSRSREEAAAGHAASCATVEVIGADAEHLARAVVGVAVDDLACVPTSGVLARIDGHSAAIASESAAVSVGTGPARTPSRRCCRGRRR